MKNYKKILIILLCAAVVMAAGTAVTMFAMGMFGSTDLLSRSGFEERTYSYPSDGIKSLSVSDLCCKVYISPSEEDTVKIVCYESDNTHYSMNADGGVLSVVYTTEGENAVFPSLVPDRELYITLPAGLLESMSVSNVSGSISVSGIAVSGEINISNISGREELYEVTAGSLLAKTTSGNINISHVTVSESAAAVSVSGKVNFQNVEAGSANLYSAGGSLMFDGVVSHGGLKAETASGNINFGSSSALSFELVSASGDIDGVVDGSKSDFAILVKTVTGSSNIASASGGLLRLSASTTTGNIRISFSR